MLYFYKPNAAQQTETREAIHIMSESRTKQPSEQISHEFDFSQTVAITHSLLSGTFAAIDCDTNASATSTICVNTNATCSGRTATGLFHSGTEGHDYRITLTASASDNQYLEQDLYLRVRGI